MYKHTPESDKDLQLQIERCQVCSHQVGNVYQEHCTLPVALLQSQPLQDMRFHSLLVEACRQHLSRQSGTEKGHLCEE